MPRKSGKVTVRTKSGKSYQRKYPSTSSYKNPKGGWTPKGIKAYNKSTGSNLKPGVKNYSKASDADKMRWTQWASRHYGPNSRKKPYVDKNGNPTRHALQATAWGEKVPKNQSQAKAIYDKAQRRKKTLHNKRNKK